MKLEEAMKQATPGPFMFHDMERHTVVTVDKNPSKSIADFDSMHTEDHQNRYNAALFIHREKHFPKLLEALKNMTERVEYLQGGEPCVNARRILKAASEVEGI